MESAQQPGNQEGANQNPLQQQKGYRGPPDRQLNKFIPNLHVKNDSKARGKPNVPPHLPPGQHRSHDTTASQSAVRNEPLRSSAFSTDFAVSEEQHVTEFTPAMTNLMLVANECLLQYSTDDPRLERSMIPEAFRYYFVAIAWIRIISLKDLQRQPLTQEERNVFSALVAEKFTIPEPLDIYIKQYGSVIPPTESHLYPTFPSLPVYQVGGFGGYYGPLGVQTHVLYEEIPCLGVAAEAVRRALTNDEPGPYQSALQTPDLIPTDNLLGYESLSLRLNEAKAKLLKLGISHTRFPEIVPRTGLNIRIIQFVSNWIAQHSTFKLSHITTISTGQGGATTQLVNSIPSDVEYEHPASPYFDNQMTTYTTSRESSSNMGIGLYIGAQQFKLNNPAEDPRPPWSCALPPYPRALPGAWRANANIRRDLPNEYRERRFIGTTYAPSNYIRLVVERLVTTKR